MLKVFENKDLQKYIISYSGNNIEKRCWICNEPIKYNTFLTSHNKIHKKIFNFFYCKNIYLCDSLCSLIYITHFKYNNGFLIFIGCTISIFICCLFLLFWISRLVL